jgi:RNA polymerase sigma-70 factor (ECF subfamily)
VDLKNLLANHQAPLPAAVIAPSAPSAASASLPRLGSAEEARLVAGCRAGDRTAMRAVYDRYRRRVYALVLRIAGEQEAEELTQEVFLKAFRAVDKFRGEAQLGTWLYRLAVNAALTQVTRSKDRKKAPEAVLEGLPAPTSPALADGDPRLRGRLELALSALPAGYRAVLVLHDIEGLQHEEIAEVLGCRVGTSKSQLHKARAKMRELLGPALAAERSGQLGRDGTAAPATASPSGEGAQ